MLLGPLLSSGELVRFVEPLHGWYHEHAVEAGGMWIALAVLAAAGILVLAPTGRRRAGA